MTTLLGLALGIAPAAGLILWWSFCQWMADVEARRAAERERKTRGVPPYSR